VKAYSPNAQYAIDPPSGAVVSLQGTSLSGIVNAQGSFDIENIPAGVYNIIFSKPGFDSIIYPAHHMLGVGTDVINDAFLIRAPGDSIVFDQVNVVSTDTTGHDTVNTSSHFLKIAAHLAGGDTAGGSYLYISNDSVFSKSHNYSNTLTSNFPGPYLVNIFVEEKYSPITLVSGSVVYIWMQPYAVSTAWPSGEYAFYTTQALGKLTRYRFVMP
jgi:hypothetical protein